MAWRPHGQADVDPSNPSAWATCDRTGFNLNLRRLRWQFQYNGTGLYNKRILVRPASYDKPAAFLLNPTLPPDPKPVLNARPEPYAVDENNVRFTLNPNQSNKTGGGPTTPGQGADPRITEDEEDYRLPDNSVNDSSENPP